MNPALIEVGANVANNIAKNRQVKREAKEARKTQKNAANLELRNKIVDIALDDEENRKAIAETAREGGKLAIKAAKIGGIVLLAGLGSFVLYKLIKPIVSKIKENSEIDEIAGSYDDKKVTLSSEDLAAMVNKLYAAFVERPWYDTWGYDGEKIIEVLSRIKCLEDWKALYQKFGKKPKEKNSDEKWDLIQFLNDDTKGSISRADYIKILDAAGAPNALGRIPFLKRKRKKNTGEMKSVASNNNDNDNSVSTGAAVSRVVKSNGKSKRMARLIEALKNRKKLKEQTNVDPNTIAQ